MAGATPDVGEQQCSISSHNYKISTGAATCLRPGESPEQFDERLSLVHIQDGEKLILGLERPCHADVYECPALLGQVSTDDTTMAGVRLALYQLALHEGSERQLGGLGCDQQPARQLRSRKPGFLGQSVENAQLGWRDAIRADRVVHRSMPVVKCPFEDPEWVLRGFARTLLVAGAGVTAAGDARLR
jgi:hypothetical protein